MTLQLAAAMLHLVASFSGEREVWQNQAVGDDAAIYLDGRCETLVQTGNVHWGIDPDDCKAFVRADQRLNQVYRKQIRSLRSEARRSLIESQRKWIKSRNEVCRLSDPIEIVSEPDRQCLLRETIDRTAVILAAKR